MISDPHSLQDPPGSSEAERLRLENERLKRQLAELQEPGKNGANGAHAAQLWRPSGVTISALFLIACVLVVVAFFAGYIPLQKRNALIVAEAQEQEHAVPRVEVTPVQRSGRNSDLPLPGSIQAIAEAPILARADGYVVRRMADIGDAVRSGQELAEVEAPEMDEQIRQAQAALQQAQAGVNQALSNLKRGQADTELARITAQRYQSLAAQGVVSKQDNDRYRSEYESQSAGLQSLQDAIAVQKSNVGAAEASVARLEQLKGYQIVKAPFDGVITVRNVDVGALVNAGNTLLFRIAQTGTLRTYVNVPQAFASSVRAGQPARLSVADHPGREFKGTVARSAKALDPASRTLLVEIHVPNSDGALLPGTYARVDLVSGRKDAPLLIPGDALIVRGEGTTVATVRPDGTVHIQKIVVGRDYGDRLEVMSGLNEGDLVIPNAGDMAREGLKVETTRASTK
jgi:RND family efflux transporter MFP subunit